MHSSLEHRLQHPRIREWLWTIVGVLFLIFVIQRFFPSPAGILIVGAVLGSLTALIAFGIILVYRTNRIVNFAQGDIGGAAAALAVQLVVGPRVPFIVSVVIGLVAGLGVGAFIELTVIRRFFKAPRLILTVATIGLAQLLAVAQLLVPKVFKQTLPSQQFPTPFDFTFHVDPVVLTGNHVIAVAAVVASIAGLGLFFRRTKAGIAIRASAENADRASLLGVPVKRISTLVWAIAAGLSALGSILRAPLVGLPIGTVMGPSLLLRALVAAVIARMENFRVAFLAAVGLGVLEQAVTWTTSRGIVTDSILFFVILGVLLAQRRGLVSRADERDASSWTAASEVRPIPAELRHLPEVRWGLAGLKVLGAIAAVVAPFVLPISRTNLLSLVLIYGIVGISFVLLTGWTGQISLGQLAFAGFGAAVSGTLVREAGQHFLVAMLAAGLVGALVAVVIGLPALRIRGLFLAVTTLAFALTAQAFFLNREFFPWLLPNGRVERPDLIASFGVSSERNFYFFVLVWLLIVLRAVLLLRRSRTGRVLVAIRDNPRAAQSYGVNLTRAKLSAFALSGFFAAFAGALFMFHQHGVFSTTPYGPDASLRAFSMVVIGGLGSIPGVLLGALYVQGSEYFLNPAFRFLATGLGMLTLLMVFPGGLGQILYRIRDHLLRLVAARRSILVPSLVADRRAEDQAPSARASLTGTRAVSAADLVAPVAGTLDRATAAAQAEGSLP